MLNTANKRASAIGIGLAIRLVLPIPDATVDSADRAQVAYSYAGIAAGSPVVALPDIVMIDATFRRTVQADVSVNGTVAIDASIRGTVTIHTER